MDAAQALFVAKGVGATSIDEIVSVAGVSKGGFYHHFASKDALLTALQDRFIDDFVADVVASQLAVPGADWRARLEAWLAAAVATFFERLPVHDVVFHEFAPVDRREMNQNRLVDLLEEFLTAGTAAGAWNVARPRLTAVMLFHALHGACDEAVIAPEMLDRKTLVEALQQFFWQAVTSPR
jgi:AcrR family transcriptional regulator